MATGGHVAMSEPRKKGKGNAYKVRQSNLTDNISEDRSSIRSAPSLQEDRPNNWDFSDWRPSSMFDSSKRIKKENPEKERDKEKEKGQSLLHESPERSDQHHHRHRTPATFPRTKMTANTPASQRAAMEKLKTQLNFSDQDELSNDGERNNERNVRSRRDRPANYTPQDVSESRYDNRPMEEQRRDNRNVNIGEGEPDNNHIVGRLMQIRDYIKQATNMKQSLLAAAGDSPVSSKAHQISQVIDQLKEQERNYMDFLLEISSSQLDSEDAAAAVDTKDEEDSESVDIAVDAQSEVSEATSESNGPLNFLEKKKIELEALERRQAAHWGILTSEARAAIEEKNSELDGLRKQRDLLRKMLGQQKQLRDLQGRQVELLQMQRNAEVDVEALGDDRSTDDAPIAAAAAANAPRSDNGESDDANNLEIVPKELKELRQKLDFLKNIYQNYPKREQEREPERADAGAAAPELEAPTVSSDQADRRKQMLQNKLNDLQEKKDSMDMLLSELQNIRHQRYMQINNDLESKDSSSVTSSMMKMEQSAAAADLADGTIADANDVLEMLDARSKLQKLEEVRGRLSQLKDLVQYYESGTQFIHEPQETEDQSSLPALSDYEDPELMRNLKAFKEEQEQVRKMFIQKMAAEEGARANMNDDDDDDESEQMSSQETETASESQLSLGPWGEDPEIQEKVKKLKDAKERLKRLQQLVNAVQLSPHAALPDDLAELVASVDGDTTSQTEQSEDKQDTSYLASEGEVPIGQMRESEYEARMEEQRGELNNLLRERQRLLGIQGQLQKLYEQFPDIPGMGEVPKSKSKLNGNITNGNGARVRQPVTFQEPPEVFTNDELYDKMRRQRILREELRQEKRELEAVMSKGRISKIYNKNQDNQSDNISYSNRSDPFGTMSGDFTTAATWGGSTTENLEEVEEEVKKGNADGDTDSSTTSEEDDAYPSDGIVQVEEEEEEEVDDQSDRETYIVEEEELRKQGPCVRPPVIESLGTRTKGKNTKRDNLDGRSQPRFNAWGSGAALPKGATAAPAVKSLARPAGKGNKKERKLRQENYRSAEEIVREESNIEILSSLRRQLETTTALCHSLLRDQQTLSQVVQGGGLSTPGVLTAGSPYRPPYFGPDPMSQVTQQQLQFSLQQCQQQMYQQHIELMQLQQQMSAIMDPARGSREVNNEDFRNPYAPHSMQNPFRLLSPSYPSPGSQNQVFSQHTPGFNFNPVFPSGFAMGSNQEGGREVWAKKSAEKKTSLSKGTDTGDDLTRFAVKPTIPDEDVPKLNLEEILNSKKKSKKPDEAESNKTKEKDSAVIGRRFPSGPTSGRAVAMAKLSSKKRTPTKKAVEVSSDSQRPGLSGQICGTAFQDNASQSSMASSIPGEQGSLAKHFERKTKGRILGELESDVPSNLSLFEALRETIYSEVATLISQNENRPHFLIEIFRELQMLSSDYLRQRALYSIQDLVSRFLTDDSVDTDSVRAAMQRMREYERKLALANGKDPDGASPEVAKAKASQKDAAEVMSSSAQDQGSESSASEVHYPRIDTQQLDQQIKGIMTEVIPILKEHMDTVCSPQLLGYVKQVVLNLTKQGDEGQEFVRFFHKQLGTLIQDSLAKFEGRKLAECGEDLLVDISEVLFNELAFFRLMQDIDDPALSTQRMLAKWRQDSVTSGTEVSTLDGRDGEMEEGSEVRLEYETTEKSDSGDDSDDEAENIEDATKATTVEEEELGKMRDDEFAGVVEVGAEKDEDSDRNASMMKVELAMSETKPFTRIGSDEDDEYMTDESHGSVADPSETAVSLEAHAEEEPEIAGEDTSEKKVADDRDDEKDVDEQESPAHINGEVVVDDDDDDDGEIGIDDLPKKLNVNQAAIEKMMQEENEAITAAAAALAINNSELAGDPLQLKEPEPPSNSSEV